MDNEITLDSTTSFGVELGKNLVISLAVSTGTVLGLAAGGYIITKLADVKKKRSTKKNPITDND